MPSQSKKQPKKDRKERPDILELQEEDEEYGILEIILGSKKDVEEFITFVDKDRQKKILKKIATGVNKLIKEELEDEYDEAEEAVNQILRKAWSMACDDLGHKESEFPCKF